MAEWHQNQKYKVVNDPQGNPQFVKQRDENGQAQRHMVQEGPRGGKYITNDDGKQVNVRGIPNQVNTWPNEDNSGIGSGHCHYGPGNHGKHKSDQGQ
jgi:hypothetical protein